MDKSPLRTLLCTSGDLVHTAGRTLFTMQCKRSVVYGVLVILVLAVLAVVTNIFSQGDNSCAKGTFPCSNSTICLNRMFLCNGHDDCPEGDDESKLTCSDIHASDYIGHLIDIYNVSEYDHCGLVNVPPDCNCTHYTWLTCKYLGWRNVPQDVSRNVTRMNLANNSIELTSDIFKRYKLEFLHLGNNDIDDLPEGVFAGQDTIIRLILSYNKLTTIRSGILRDLKQLQWLMITNNNLSYIDLDDFKYLNLTWVELSNNSLTFEGQRFPAVPHLKQLSLENNSMEVIGEHTFSNLEALNNLDLQGNRIRYIHPKAFRRLYRLERLDLSKNEIKTLPPTIFHDLEVLMKLNLAFNPMHYIPEDLFRVKTLLSLNLDEIEIENIDVEMFSYARKLEFVYFKKFYYCSYTPEVKNCKPTTDGVSSLRHLLVKPILRVTVWVVAAMTCVGNGMVLWGRFSFRDENRVLSLVIRNLAVSDMLMGLYLVVIGTQDSQFRDNYQREAHGWMSSWTCTLIGVVAMTSSEVSVLILVFMSLERFLLIAVPFSGHQNMTMKTACLCLASIWIFGISISSIPVMYWWNSTRFYGTNGMCFPLHIDDPYLTGWQYSAFIFLGLNTVGLIMIAILYTWMFVSIWKTRHATPISSVGDFEFVIRFFFIVLTDASCWAPIIALKLVALSRVHIPADLYGWVVVFILPVNSAVNPILYTFTTSKFREQIFKCGWHQGSHRSLVTRRQSTADTDCSRSSTNRNMVACSMMGRKKSLQSDLYTKLPMLNGKFRANNGMHSNTKDPVVT